MSLYTTWSRSTHRDVIRREMMDTNTRWTSDAEINMYLDLWLNDVQEEFELVWACATATVGSASGSYIINTATLTPPMLRCEAVYYQGFRLAGRLLQDIEVGNPLWRGADEDTPRVVVNYPDPARLLLWPTPPDADSAKTIIFEYPCTLSFATDSSTSGLPFWTQWSAKPYVCSKLYLRPGPINDVKRAQRYAALYSRALQRVRASWVAHLPERYRVLKPAIGDHRLTPYECDILCPPPAWTAGTNTATGT